MPKNGRSVARQENQFSSRPGGMSSMTHNWDLACIQEAFDVHKLCNGWMRVKNLQPGSDMRRRGEVGVLSWMERLDGKGITNVEYALRAVLTSAEQEKAILALVMITKEKYKKAGIPTPDRGIDLGRLEDATGALFDGGHRHTGLSRLEDRCRTPESKAVYIWVPVILYSRAMLPKMVLYSKVINATGSCCVPEDSLERLTFTQGMIAMYTELHHEGDLRRRLKWVRTKSLSAQMPPYVSDLVVFLAKQAGGSASTSGFFRQIVTAALHVRGPCTTYLKSVLDDAEKRRNKVHSLLIVDVI